MADTGRGYWGLRAAAAVREGGAPLCGLCAGLCHVLLHSSGREVVVHCDQCGSRIPDYARFCRKCGARQVNPETPDAPGTPRSAISVRPSTPNGGLAAERLHPDDVAPAVPGPTESKYGTSTFFAVVSFLVLVGFFAWLLPKAWPSSMPNPVPTIIGQLGLPAPLAVLVVAPTETPEPEPTRDPNAVLFTKYISADGDGAYIRYAPDREAKVKAWPDGTPLGIIEFVSMDWARVKAPDGFIGYIPRDYLSDSAPGPPPGGFRHVYEVALTNLRYERWGGPIDPAETLWALRATASRLVASPTSSRSPTFLASLRLAFSDWPPARRQGMDECLLLPVRRPGRNRPAASDWSDRHGNLLLLH